ncbi:MAG: low molecular weight protein-tyrosine-phosphatase [Gammaproteobacteria bacterium]|jgi:protein-tyrosine phosphatase|nr:low molecular weight protein-tyrosine-phosphatase [Gammaproteobacteria bacterium]
MNGIDAQPLSVLFVCMGNICRSPTAEGLMRARVEAEGRGDAFLIDSAGTHGYHIGAPPDARAIAAAAERGVALQALRARQVQATDFERFDYILAMDEENLRALDKLGAGSGRARVEQVLNYSRRYRGAAVPDPYYGGSEGFQRVIDMLDDAIDGFLERHSRQ